MQRTLVQFVWVVWSLVETILPIDITRHIRRHTVTL
jgi:hypothetical protein